MPSAESRLSGWHGVCLVAVTYVYFLIFAQFAFLKRLSELDIANTHLKAVMAAMAAGGILLSLLSPRVTRWPCSRRRLQVAFAACAAAALLTLLSLDLAASIAVAFLIGSGLGMLTVTLVTDLRAWLGARNPLLRVGLGTGLGYFICNLPALFTASPQAQAITSASFCAAAILILQRQPALLPAQPFTPVARATPFPRALVCFTALVWLDSAAFFIIQSTPALKAGTWEGSLHLWTNAGLHLLAALVSVWLLGRRGLSFVLSLAFVALGLACLLLLSPSQALLASCFYPVGVSLYSVALVAYPSLLGPARSLGERGRQAGWIYAIAGWAGSAMGIGMGQHLGYVPPAFVFFAGLLIALPQLLRRRREAIATALVLVVAVAIQHALPRNNHAPQTQIQRGRQVYVAEGCIHCHSQYVRPHSPDVLMWGPAQSVERLREEQPPLIGNRRQGPDLSEVGSRRSPFWLKVHLYDPTQLSYHSVMPSYSYLFRDGRGEELVAYLASLQSGDIAAQLRAERAWHPSAAAYAEASAAHGAVLFSHSCATCHATAGQTRQQWGSSFRQLPPLLNQGADADRSPTRVAQIVKFGIPGTSMPGHEYFSGRDVASLSLWLSRTRSANQSTATPTGETK